MTNKVITVKNIRVNERRSYETYYYDAELYIGSKLIGTAHNYGQGGLSLVEIKDQFKDEVNQIIGAMDDADIGLSYPHKVKMTLDLYVDCAVYDYANEKTRSSK